MLGRVRFVSWRDWGVGCNGGKGTGFLKRDIVGWNYLLPIPLVEVVVAAGRGLHGDGDDAFTSSLIGESASCPV